jgi:Holliday junction resolvasome RuvABC endonuclease subunit
MSDVVGLDPSLTGTGVAVGLALTSTITTKPTDPAIVARLARLRHIVAAVLRVVPAGALVVIEGPSFGREQPGLAHLRAGLWWTLVNDLAASGCTVLEVPPKTLKKFATGSGTASKSDMRMALFKRLGVDNPDDNQVDAIWLREAGLHLVGDPDAIALPKPQLAVIEGLRVQLSSSG